jgi:lysophospholipase L1-like esterase
MNLTRNHFLSVLVMVPLLFASCHPVSRYIDSADVLSWEPEIRLIDSLNAVEEADANTLLVTGSSSVRLWDSIHVDMAPYVVMQRGYGGAKLSDFNHYAQRIIKPQRFKAILVFIANDISGGAEDRSPEEVLKLFKFLVKQIRERNPDTPVCWIETTPTPSRWHAIEQIRQANKLIREYCEKNGDLYFIETYDVYTDPAGRPDSTLFRDDMLHLNREGYLLWAGRIKKSLGEAGITP